MNLHFPGPTRMVEWCIDPGSPGLSRVMAASPSALQRWDRWEGRRP